MKKILHTDNNSQAPAGAPVQWVIIATLMGDATTMQYCTMTPMGGATQPHCHYETGATLPYYHLASQIAIPMAMGDACFTLFYDT